MISVAPAYFATSALTSDTEWCVCDLTMTLVFRLQIFLLVLRFAIRTICSARAETNESLENKQFNALRLRDCVSESLCV